MSFEKEVGAAVKEYEEEDDMEEAFDLVLVVEVAGLSSPSCGPRPVCIICMGYDSQLGETMYSR